MKIIFTILIIFLTQQALLRAEWEKCNTPQAGGFEHITKLGDYYFGATRYGLARSSDSANTWEIINNQLKDNYIGLIFPAKNSLYIISDSKVYKSDDYGVTVQYITETNFPYFYKNVFSNHEDTLFFIINDILKYYVDDFTRLNDYFNPKDSISCNRIFEFKGDLIISTNKGYFRTYNYTNNIRKFDGLDDFPSINFFSHNDNEIYFGSYEIIYKSDDNLESYTKIIEQIYGISDIQANAEGLYVAFYYDGIRFYNRITKEFDLENKYKNIGFDKITIIDEDIFFYSWQNLLKTQKIGDEYLISGYEDSYIEKVRFSNDKMFGILSGRLMYSDDDGLNWNIYDNDYLQLTSLEIIDSVFFISYLSYQHDSESAILRSSNYGKDWIKINNDNHLPYNAKDFLYYKKDLFMASGYFGIFVSKDTGKTWFQIDNSIYSSDEFLAIDSFLFVISYWSIKQINLNDNFLTTDFKYFHPTTMNYMIQVNDDIINYTYEYSWRFYYLSNDRGNSFKRIDKPIYIPRHHLYNETVKKQIIDSTLHFSFDDGVTWINLFDEKDYDFYDFFILNNYVIANSTQGLYRKKLSDFGTTSVKMPTQDERIVVSPNPATDFITIQYSNKGLKPFAENEKVQIFDMLGIEIHKTQTGMSELLKINVSHLPSGVYFIRIGDKVEKFVKM
jgi:hypothetical protein